MKIKKHYRGFWVIRLRKNCPYIYIPTLSTIFWKIIRTISKNWNKITKKTIYYTVWSRDCDMCESTNAGYVYGEKNWDKMMDEVGEWAEGPVSYERISKEEYEEFVAPPVRDRIMEAYENGRGTSIYV